MLNYSFKVNGGRNSPFSVLMPSGRQGFVSSHLAATYEYGRKSIPFHRNCGEIRLITERIIIHCRGRPLEKRINSVQFCLFILQIFN